MRIETIKKLILMIILLILLITTFISIFNFNWTEIPSIVSFIGWIIVIISNLAEKFKSFIYISFKGFFSTAVISLKLTVDEVEDFDIFIRNFNNELARNSSINIISFPIIPANSYRIITEYKNYPINFNIYDRTEHLSERIAYFEFEPITKNHRSVLEHIKKLDIYIRTLEQSLNNRDSVIDITLKIDYPDNNNPLIGELVNQNNICLQAKGKNYTITNNHIEMHSKPNQLLENTEKTLLGKLND